MERGEDDSGVDNISVDPSSSSVNNLILDYYKKFGRNRDLEQFFSLSTAQSEIRDPAGTFWRKMKSQNDSSDSGEKKSESSTELCRISIKCSIPEPSSLQQRSYGEHQNSDSESPPIVTEEVAPGTHRNSDEESVKSEDVQSQKSNDATLDTSMNKPHSPTSSITSQRKLEWDSLADVGYGNESDRKTSASSLSTLERLALNQQYSHNDSKQSVKLGPPTSQSTPVEDVDTKSKGRKGLIKKTTKIYQKDVDLVELNVPHNLQTDLPQAISVNLSKHICFNVEKDGGINIDNIKKNISVSPEKNVESSKQTQDKLDKEIQTSLLVNKDKNNTSNNNPLINRSLYTQRFPVLISLNSLKNRNRKRKKRIAKKKLKKNIRLKNDNDNISEVKPTEQVSEAESFEYMPGHIYNQNRLKVNQSRGTHVGNKSSLESSGSLTTYSSKGSNLSFTKDLEKSIELLRTILKQNNDDSTLKKKLIKEVVQRLIKSKFRDDESSTDFLSGLSFNSLIVGERNHTTTSTSDANNTGDKPKLSRPKKLVLQTAKFDSNAIASTSQSAPNLPSVANSEKPLTFNLAKPFLSNTDSDISSKEKNLEDSRRTKTSEEFYIKYLEALKREQSHKKHVKDKENYIKQKSVSSETALTQLANADLKTQSKLKSLLKDLTRNNYNDGSGDASNLEGHGNANPYTDPQEFINNQRSHSVFTLSSGHSEGQSKNPRFRNIIKSAIHNSSKPGCSKNDHHYCCCPYHTDHPKVGFTDSSTQVNIKSNRTEKMGADELQESSRCTKCKKESPRNIAKVVSDSETGDLKYICVCSDEGKSHNVNQNYLIYKCSRLVNKSIQLGDSLTRGSSTHQEQNTKEIYTCDQKSQKPKINQDVNSVNMSQCSKSSQTNLNLNLVQRKSSEKSTSSQFSDSGDELNIARSKNGRPKFIQEAIRSIQTDISINPRLSDPCLSDINIIDANQCVELIKEQYKEIPKSSSENNTEGRSSQKKSQLSSCNGSERIIPKSSSENICRAKPTLEYAYMVPLDKDIQSDLGLLSNNQNETYTGNFTIPIQGTNMTLKVNLGATEFNKNSNNVSTKTQGVVTEQTNVTDHCTSLREDCTKSVQCNANIFQRMKEDIKDDNINVNEGLPISNTCAVNTCSVDKHKCNTYPKKDTTCARKPLLRSNTDISNFDTRNLPQFDITNYEKIANKGDFSIDNRKALTEQPKTMNHSRLPDKCAACYNNSKFDYNDKNPIEYTTKSNTNCQPGKCTTCSNEKVITDQLTKSNNQDKLQKCTACGNQEVFTDQSTKSNDQNKPDNCTACGNQKVLTDQSKSYKQDNPECTFCDDKKVFKDRAKVPSQNHNQPEKCSTDSNNKDLIEQSIIPNNQNQCEKYLSCSTPETARDEPIKSNIETQLEKCTACFKQKDNRSQQTYSDNATHESPDNLTSESNDHTTSKKCQTCSNHKNSTEKSNKNKQTFKKCTSCSNEKDSINASTKPYQRQSEMYMTCSSKCSKGEPNTRKEKDAKFGTQLKSSASDSESNLDCNPNADPLLNMIEKITKRYTKKDIQRSQRKKCFKEIMNVLNYLLDTEDTDDRNKESFCPASKKKQDEIQKANTEIECCPRKSFVDKGVQLSVQPKFKKCCESESSEIAATTEFPTTSSDSATCKVLNKIKKECEKYHQKRCKSHNGLKPCETSSTTSVNCDQCKRVHHCHCLRHKCKSHKIKTCGEKPKKCVAYNLILQTSDSVASEEVAPGNNRPLRSIIVRVPSKRQAENIPFKEMAAKFEGNQPNCRPRSPYRGYRSRSLPNESEISSTDEFLRKPQMYTVREYLERNRPDFVEKCSRRQDCLKTINETRANERDTKRKLLSLQLAKQQTLSSLTDDELRHFAKQLSEQLRRKKVAPKFISERDMKKHSEKIYKSLPEVTRKKEELKKENIKKTNLLMANIFKKNLQKKTLRGSVNLSNYSTVIKI